VWQRCCACTCSAQGSSAACTHASRSRSDAKVDAGHTNLSHELATTVPSTQAGYRTHTTYTLISLHPTPNLLQLRSLHLLHTTLTQRLPPYPQPTLPPYPQPTPPPYPQSTPPPYPQPTTPTLSAPAAYHTHTTSSTLSSTVTSTPPSTT